MIRRLQLGAQRLAIELTGEVVCSAQEAVKEVDHIAVAVSGHKVLRVATRRKFKAQVFRRIVLQAQSRLHAHHRQRTVVVQAQSGLNEPAAFLALVIQVAAEFRCVLLLVERSAHRIGVLVLGVVAHEFQTVFKLIVLAQQVREVQTAVETVDLAFARTVLQLR